MSEKPNYDKFPEIVAGLWKTRSGKVYRSMPIDGKRFDQLQAILSKIEVGGKLVFAEVPEEKRKGETSPQGYIKYMTPAQVAEEKEYMDRKKAERDAGDEGL